MTIPFCLTCCRPSPCDRLSRSLTTTTAPPRPGPIGRQRTQPPPPAPDVREMWWDRDGSRVHLLPHNESGAQLYPGGRREYAADFPPALSLPMGSVGTDATTATMVTRTAARPISTRFEPVPVNEASHAGSSRTPSRLARRTRTIWQCWHVPALSGPLPPSSAFPKSGCPQLHPAATTAQR